MNASPQNKYERHVVEDDFNLTPDGPLHATAFVTADDAIKMLKMLFGEALDDDNTEVLSFPPEWGVNAHDTVLQWIHEDKINDAHRAELQMNPLVPMPRHNLDAQNQEAQPPVDVDIDADVAADEVASDVADEVASD